MKEVYILQNQNSEYLSRQGEWLDGSDSSSLFYTPHKDVAINTRVEQTIKDPTLRVHLVESQLDEKSNPTIQVQTAELELEAG